MQISEYAFTNESRIGRKLRIGIASAELGQHAVAEFLEPILEKIDRSRFHIALYPTAARSDARSSRFRELADRFTPVAGIPGKAAADLIRNDKVDILVDTTGYMNGYRLDIFAHRAAPVQCHYIGYHGTIGLTEMDWFIADEVLLPAECDSHFREAIWRLPRLWMCYRGDTSLPETQWTPDPRGRIWLGSFNNLAKVRQETLDLWSRVMQAIPQSMLLLKDRRSSNDSVKQRIRKELSVNGIDDDRVVFLDRVDSWNAHMQLYDKLDIALDTIPLNSGTTAFDALWMGVPLVAIEGNWIGGRGASTILRSLGKEDWVARSEDEYVEICAALAGDVEGRRSLRRAQRSLMANSPLCDANGLTRELEGAFESMYDLWWRKFQSL
jgi:predicted O-linked N-acetylglucosamine transferase (SPINDLY family)